MNIVLENVSKKFLHTGIFKNISFTFKTGNIYAITGANGSGKTTLLKIIAGLVTPSDGKIRYIYNGKNISAEQIYRYISIAAPYMELIEEFTLEEQIKFHTKLKPFFSGIDEMKIISLMELNDLNNKTIKSFSSGTKQKLKLGLAFYSNTPLLVLDEPLSNLDKKNSEWYQETLKQYSKNRTVIICSNMKTEEFPNCNEIINIENYKE